MDDYEQALHYLLWYHWDDLFTLMIRTEDDMLGKKIQVFLHAYYYENREKIIIESHDALIRYIDHALDDEMDDLKLFSDYMYET